MDEGRHSLRLATFHTWFSQHAAAHCFTSRRWLYSVQGLSIEHRAPRTSEMTENVELSIIGLSS